MTHLRAVIIPAEYVTVEEGAKQIGVHGSTVLLAIKRGDLPAITCESASSPIGWRYLVRRADIDALSPRPSGVPAASIDPPRRFGQVLRRLRLRGGWSQRDLCARMGLRNGVISRYENGVQLPSAGHFERLTEALRCSASEERELMDAMADEADYRDRLRASGKPWPRVAHIDGTLPRRAEHTWAESWKPEDNAA